MRERPDCTVVIPTRNRWRFLRRSLASALAQRDVTVEVVVVDDGSTDDTRAGLADVDDERVVVARNDESCGVAVARNIGLERAKGEWVALLDDDDVWAPTKLRRQLDAATESGAGWAYSGVVTVDEELNPVAPTDATVAPDRVRERVLAANVLTTGSNISARRDAFEQIGGFDETLALLDDWDMCIRLAHAYPAVAVSDALVAYVRHPATHQRLSGDLVLEDIRRLRRKHRPQGRLVDGAAVARWAATGHRYGGRRATAAALYIRSGLELRSAGNVLRGLVTPFTSASEQTSESVDEPRPAWLDEYAASA